MSVIDELSKRLSDKGFTGSLNDKMFKELRQLGYTGSLPDMLAKVGGFKTYLLEGVDSINTPSITSPVDGAIDQPEEVVLQSSAFSTTPPGADVHTSSSWRVRDAIGTVVWESLNSLSLLSITVPAGVLQEGQTYTAEVRHEGQVLVSAWSPLSEFNTASSFVSVSGVFSTALYNGTGSTNPVINGIDFLNKGGLTWFKRRDGAVSHYLMQPLAGNQDVLRSDTTDAKFTGNYTAPQSDGFVINAINDQGINASGASYVAWSFRQAPKFFDIVQYTGDGTSGRQIAHDLGVAPGVVVVKRLDSSGDWRIYHRALGAPNYVEFDTGAVAASSNIYPQDPDDSHFYVGNSTALNASGGQYVAYLWAHDPSDSGIIQCGSFSADAAGSFIDVTVSLGWEPQFVLLKSANSTGNWFMLDSTRGVSSISTTDVANDLLYANTSDAEIAERQGFYKTSSGFVANPGNLPGLKADNETYIYMAVRAAE
tara:strand:+ start:44433 stop:45875 length:1443 start_codon:yes stop_codon:yes gene_type:complete